MTRKYEIVYIFDSALEESQITEILEPLHELLKAPDALTPVTASSHWGKRTLAYEVAGKSVGYYVVVRFDTDPTVLTEFERRLKLEERILRYLIVIDEGLKPLIDPSEAEAQASDAKPGETTTGEPKPAETRTAEATPTEPKTAEATTTTGEDA